MMFKYILIAINFLIIQKSFNLCLINKKELKKFPNSRSLKGIENLVNFRGSQNGLKKAEAFEMIKFMKSITLVTLQGS